MTMADIDPQLVAQITKAVIDALAQAPSAGAAGGQAAPIKPPVGVCTGDYSQFTDRPDLAGSDGKKPGAGRSEAPDPAPPGPPPLSGIITAQQLQEAIGESPDGVALIAHDARPTPLANDYIRENPAKVRRAEAPAESAAMSVGGRPWLWWAEGHCPAVVATTAGLTGQMVHSGAARSEAGLVQALRDIAAGVRSRSLRGGVVFVRSAARAAVLANRSPALRAVVGKCPEAVEQGIAEVGANVLIIEYPHTGADRLASMVTRIVQTQPQTTPHMERELADMHRRA